MFTKATAITREEDGWQYTLDPYHINSLGHMELLEKHLRLLRKENGREKIYVKIRINNRWQIFRKFK